MQQVNTWAKYLVQLVIPCITGTIIGWDGIIHFYFAKDTGSLSVSRIGIPRLYSTTQAVRTGLVVGPPTTTSTGSE